MHFDIFNGDADGIFALHQYRLAHPLEDRQLITGVKRDIHLLSKIEKGEGNSLVVFDISLDSNRGPLLQLLANHNSIVYFDHHFAGDIPESPLLTAFIDTSAETCSSLIVNNVLGGKYPLWAICGAFGDNLHQAAKNCAGTLDLNEDEISRLQELGELFNYNGYGSALEDLHFHPQELYLAVAEFTNPFDFLEHSPELAELRRGYQEDIDSVMQIKEMKTAGKNRIYLLPDTPWARRVSGVFSNFRAREQTGSAHAVISENKDRTLRISVRAPLDDRRDADSLCKLFPTGGGRSAAAGINSLPSDMLDSFIEKFLLFYR